MADKARYINPYTDFGFKKLFGEEGSKDLLIDFLNQLLPEKHFIQELSFRNVENNSDTATERKAIFDIHCISHKGERFVVEMQKAKIKYFKDRALFYTVFPIKEQAEKGNWDFKLDPIYYIAILDFFYDVETEKAKVKREVKLKDQDCEVFFDKLNYVFLQMPAFRKEEHELVSRYDKWLYFLKNLENFEEIPDILKEPVFEKAFDIAEICNLNVDDYTAYQKSLLYYRDMVNIMRTKYEEGREEGRGEGREEMGESVVIKCLQKGMSIAEIMEIIGLSKDEILEIQKKLNKK